MKKMKTVAYLVLGMLTLVSLGAMYVNVNAEVENPELVLSFNGEKLEMQKSGEVNGYDVSQMSLDTKNTIEIENREDVDYIEIDDKRYYSEEKISYIPEKIDEYTKIKVSAKFNGDDKEYNYYINTLSSKFPEYEVEASSPYDGDYYMTTHNEEQNYVFVLNEDGSMKFYRETESNPFDFKKTVTSDGKVRYTYLSTYTDKSKRISAVGYSPTYLEVLDENYNELNQITMEGYGDIVKGTELENHDYIYIDDNHYILSSYQRQKAENIPEELSDGNDPYIVDVVIQEIKDGKAVWQWKTSEHEELYAQSQEGNDYSTVSDDTLDYTHFNSMTIDESDGNLVCSFRNLDEVLKIDRTTGEIIWTLGGDSDDFSLTEEQKFSRQHNARITDGGYITLYDNGIKNENTRVVKLKLDEENMSVVDYKSYSLDDYYKYMGSVQEIDSENEVFLIGTGGKTTDQDTVAIEKNFSTGEEYFRFGFKSGESMYRCYKVV